MGTLTLGRLTRAAPRWLEDAFGNPLTGRRGNYSADATPDQPAPDAGAAEDAGATDVSNVDSGVADAALDGLPADTGSVAAGGSNCQAPPKPPRSCGHGYRWLQ